MVVQKDKILHFIAGAIIAVVFSTIAAIIDQSAVPVALWGFFAAAIIGGLKEGVWDTWLGRGTSDNGDLYATGLGGVLGGVLVGAIVKVVF